jgi:hypothetical protein
MSEDKGGDVPVLDALPGKRQIGAMITPPSVADVTPKTPASPAYRVERSPPASLMRQMITSGGHAVDYLQVMEWPR